MTARHKTAEPEVGSILEIPLSNGRTAYGRVLTNPLMAFYDIQSETPLSPTEILKSPVAFMIWVMNSAVASGRWRVVGHAPLEQALETSPWFFKQDAISRALSLYREGVERPATIEECLGLERAAVWSAEHVESRLEDHFAGQPNKWVEGMRLKA